MSRILHRHARGRAHGSIGIRRQVSIVLQHGSIICRRCGHRTRIGQGGAGTDWTHSTSRWWYLSAVNPRGTIGVSQSGRPDLDAVRKLSACWLLVVQSLRQRQSTLMIGSDSTQRELAGAVTTLTTMTPHTAARLSGSGQIQKPIKRLSPTAGQLLPGG